jgi:hypothetical protein
LDASSCKWSTESIPIDQTMRSPTKVFLQGKERLQLFNHLYFN